MRHDRRACFTATLASTALFAGLVATALAGCAASQGVAPATASTPAAAQARATARPASIGLPVVRLMPRRQSL